MPDLPDAGLTLADVPFHWAADWLYAIPTELVLDAALGAALLYAVRAVYFRLRGVEAIALDDVTFIAAAGLRVGVRGIAPPILTAALTTLAAALARHDRFVASEATRRRCIPFGPARRSGSSPSSPGLASCPSAT